MIKIAKVEAIPLRQVLKEPLGAAAGWKTARESLIVRITADDGTVGYGECYRPITGGYEIVKTLITSMLLDEDPMNTTVLWEKIRYKLEWDYKSFIPYSVLSGVDIALWDLKGRLMGVPVSTLLGGRFRDKVPAYAGGQYMKNVKTVEEQIANNTEEAQIHLSKGFRMLKLKIGLSLLGWGYKEDIQLLEGLRKAVGDGIEIMADANRSYSIPQALRVGEACGRLGLYWFEEPLPPHDYDGYAFLTGKLNVAIAAGESWAELSEFAKAFERRCMSCAQPDVCAAGGITQLQRIGLLARMHNIDYAPHLSGSPIAMAATLHVLANAPGKPLLEFIEISLARDLLEEPFRAEEGYVQVPTGPGLGIKIDEKILEKYRIDK